MPKLLLIFFLFLFLLSCGKKIDITKDWSANKFYNTAHDKLENGDYQGAIKFFEKLQGRFPYSKESRQANIELIYTYYKYDEFDSALSSANQFINENPDYANLDYVYYLRGIIRYNKDTNLLARLYPQNIAYRDNSGKKLAYQDFNKLIKKFPKSKYYQDSVLRMRYLRNKLAEHDLLVARFYFDRQAYVATINRSKQILSEFPKTPAVAEALHLLKDSYRAIGQPKIMQQYQKIIAKNNLQNYHRITPLQPPEIIKSMTE